MYTNQQVPCIVKTSTGKSKNNILFAAAAIGRPNSLCVNEMRKHTLYVEPCVPFVCLRDMFVCVYVCVFY